MRVSPRTISVVLISIALTTVTLAAALRIPVARSYDIGAQGDAYVTVNFYSPERDAVSGTTFRWSGPDAALLVPDTYAGAAIISARLHGNPDGSAISLYTGGRSGRLLVLRPAAGWRVYRVLTSREMLWDASGLPGKIRLAGATSSPRAADPRELGLALDRLQVTPIAASPGPLGPPLGHALLLTWAIVLVGAGLVLVIESAIPAPARRAVRRTALSIPLALAVGGGAWWAWRDSASLGWVLPLSPAVLGIISVAMVALWAGAHLIGREAASISRRAGVILGGGLLGIAHLLLLLPLPIELRGLGALIILGVPGALLSGLMLGDTADPLERIFIGLCGALALPILMLLALQFVPSALAPLPLLALCDLQTALAALALLRRPPRPAATSADHPYLALIIIMLFGAAFRLPFLGRADLHDDETTAVVAAVRMIGGMRDQLLIQLKGPVQVLLPAGPLALTGQANEWLARMPFLLAGMGVILGGYLVASRLLGGTRRWAALAVAATLAADGFLIAFSRIVQYQSIVMIMGLGAFWCCWRFYRGEGRPWPNLVAAAIMMAVALLSHYDAIYVAPALAWLVFAGGRSRGWGARQWARGLALPSGVGAALLASFYVPFILHPHFYATIAHIGERSGQQQGAGWTLFNNLAGSYQLATFYNTTPAIVAAVVLLTGTLAGAIVAYVRPRLLGWPLAGLLVATSIDILRGPGRSLLMDHAWLGLIGLGLPMIALILSRGTPIAMRSTLIWFSGACLAVSFLLEQPRTHMHVMDVPAALLIGQGLAAISQSRRPLVVGLRPWLAAVGAAIVVLATPYAYALFDRQVPEYQRLFPMTALAAYPALSTEPAAAPIGGSVRLGYPAQDGWKTVGELYRTGVLNGPFASNQTNEVTNWYTRGLLRCGEEPEYYLIAMSLANPAIPSGYHLFGIVQVDGRNQLLIYSRSPLRSAPQIFDADRFRGSFDAQPLPRLPLPEEACAAG